MLLLYTNWSSLFSRADASVSNLNTETKSAACAVLFILYLLRQLRVRARILIFMIFLAILLINKNDMGTSQPIIDIRMVYLSSLRSQLYTIRCNALRAVFSRVLVILARERSICVHDNKTRPRGRIYHTGFITTYV